MPVSPLRDAVVDPDQVGVGADQIGKDCEQQAATDRKTNATVSASPVAVSGSRRESRILRRRGCFPTASPTLRAVSSAGAGAGAATRGYRQTKIPTVTPAVRARTNRSKERHGLGDGCELGHGSDWRIQKGACAPSTDDENTPCNSARFRPRRRPAGERSAACARPVARPGGPAERVGALRSEAPPGDRLRARDARRAGGDRDPLDRPWVSRHPRGRARLGHRRRRRTGQRAGSPCTGRRPHRCLVARLDHRGRGRAADRRRLPAIVFAVLRQLAHRRVLRVRACRRVGDLPCHDTRCSFAPASRRAARAPAGQRQLPVRAHGGVDRRLRRHRAAAHVEDHERGLPVVRVAARLLDPAFVAFVAHVSRDAPSAGCCRRRVRRRRCPRRGRVCVPLGRRGGRGARSERRPHEGRGHRPLRQDARRRAARAAPGARGRRESTTRSGARSRRAARRRLRCGARWTRAPS